MKTAEEWAEKLWHEGEGMPAQAELRLVRQIQREAAADMRHEILLLWGEHPYKKLREAIRALPLPGD